jgi:hypothetical protein
MPPGIASSQRDSVLCGGRSGEHGGEELDVPSLSGTTGSTSRSTKVCLVTSHIPTIIIIIIIISIFLSRVNTESWHLAQGQT